MTLEELQKLAKEKYDALNTVKSARSQMEYELAQEARKKVKEVFGDAEAKATNEFAEVDALLKAELEKVRIAESEAKIPFPVGTKMVYWEKGRFSNELKKIRFGVLEIFKKGDEYPSNLRWNAPNPGDIIVRVMTKEGKPGKKVESLGRTDGIVYRCGWLPEGQYPKDIK